MLTIAALPIDYDATLNATVRGGLQATTGRIDQILSGFNTPAQFENFWAGIKTFASANLTRANEPGEGLPECLPMQIGANDTQSVRDGLSNIGHTAAGCVKGFSSRLHAQEYWRAMGDYSERNIANVQKMIAQGEGHGATHTGQASGAEKAGGAASGNKA